MTNLLNYNAGVWGGWAIMASMLVFHIGRIIWRKHKRTRRLMRMVENSERNHHANLRILGEGEK